MGIDVFSREVAAQAIPSKDPATVNKALKKTQEALVGDEKSFSLTTDLGAEFNKIEDVIPEQATWRQKIPSDKQATSVLDRNMGTIKQDLSAKVATKGGDWSEKLPSVINAYNNRPHEAVFGPRAKLKREMVEKMSSNSEFYSKMLIFTSRIARLRSVAWPKCGIQAPTETQRTRRDLSSLNSDPLRSLSRLIPSTSLPQTARRHC